MNQPLTNKDETTCYVSFSLSLPLQHWGKLEALAFFSTPADPIMAATGSQDPAAGRQLGPGQKAEARS